MLLGLSPAAMAAPSIYIKDYDWGKVKLSLDYGKNKNNTRYHGIAYLLNASGKEINKTKISGCTFGGKISDLPKYLQEKKLMAVQEVGEENAAISILSECGAQNYWHTYVLTAKCTAAVEDTSAATVDKNRIHYSIYYGFGARRKSVPMTLVIDPSSNIKVSPPEYSEFRNQPITAALAAKHMRDFRYISNNFSAESFDGNKEVKFLRKENDINSAGVDNTYQIPLTYAGIEQYISGLDKKIDSSSHVVCK